MKAWLSILALAVVCWGTGCGNSEQTGGHGHEGHHHHDPPHGGTAVELGEHAYHLEFVRDAAAGKLSAYILSAHMETFVRVPEPGFTVTAKVAGKEENLEFKAVTNTATGETVGDTALFEVKADWLKTTPKFEATLKELSIKGTKFTNVSFKFPEGSEEHAHAH